MIPTSLDTSKHNCNSKCGKRTLLGPLENSGKENLVGVARQFCKAWNCGFCGPRKAKWLQKAIARHAHDNGLNKFLTLTVDPKKLPDDVDSIKYIRKTFCKFRVYLKRRYGEAILYISILEFHQSGLPHLHILLSQYIPQAWISESWAALGGGKVVWIKQVIDLHRISYYLSKYLTKNLILSAPHGTRRWTTSRGIRLTEKKKVTGWIYTKAQFNVLYELLKEDAISVETTKDGLVRFFTVKEGVIEF